MSEVQDHARARIVAWMAGVSALLLVLLLLINVTGTRPDSRAGRIGQPVLPGMTATLEGVDRVRITTADTIYTLARSPRGWIMQETGGYPVRIARMAALAAGLETLSWDEAKTRDPAKFDRIGLGDPRTGGAGALIELMDTDGRVTSSLITGRRGDRIYARRPQEDAAFRVSGELPPFYRRETWLDLDVIDLPAEVIRAVRLVEANGSSLYLQRVVGGGPRDFRPAPPNQNDRLISRMAASAPALALSRLAPTDVKPADSLETRPVARHFTMTHDGLEVAVNAYKEADGFYITLHAVEAGEGARRAETINQKSDGWAFRLSEYDWNDFSPRIDQIIRRSQAPPPP